jgi:hypothetical protein
MIPPMTQNKTDDLLVSLFIAITLTVFTVTFYMAYYIPEMDKLEKEKAMTEKNIQDIDRKIQKLEATR